MKKQCFFVQFYANYQRIQSTPTATFLNKTPKKYSFYSKLMHSLHIGVEHIPQTYREQFPQFVRVLLESQILHMVLLLGGKFSSAPSRTRFKRNKWGIFGRRLRSEEQSSSPNLIKNWRRFWADKVISLHITYLFSDTISSALKNAAKGHLVDEGLVE